MKPQTRKTPKACEPCRNRKIKCDGQQPCANCQTDPTACSYRLRTRIRQSRRLPSQIAAVASPDLFDAVGPRRQDTQWPAAVPSGLPAENTPDRTLSQQRGVVATTPDNSHIYYGPASAYALGEHIRQSILRPTAQRATADAGGSDGAQDVTPLLDVFMQRHLFFGTPQPPPGLVPSDWHALFVGLVPRPIAESFLENFKTAVMCLLPFYTAEDLASSLNELYDSNGSALSSQQCASMLAVLAIGALLGTETETGETLFLMARQQNFLHEDAVSLDAIQFWLLAAEYQLNMGRATPAYLAIGSACRKAAAMGLVGARGGARAEGSVTAWTLYYYDCWYSISGGRKKMIALADITHDRPTGHPLLANLCQLTSHLEEVAAIINDDKPRQLHDLFKLVSEVHSRLQTLGETVGIGTMTGMETPAKATSTLFFHNAYFQVIQYAFRPFIVAQYVLSDQTRETEQLWIRQACRFATDAAVDGIASFQAISQKLKSNEVRRRDGFSLESCCSLLLLDSLRHPTKHEHNSTYVGQAVAVLSRLPSVPPTAALLASIQSIASAVSELVDTRKRRMPLLSESTGAMEARSSVTAEDMEMGDERECGQGLQGEAMTDQESFTAYLSQEGLGALVMDPFGTALFWQ